MEPIEKIMAGLMIAILATLFFMNERTVHHKLEERRADNYAISRVVECENQISLLRERIERLEESK